MWCHTGTKLLLFLCWIETLNKNGDASKQTSKFWSLRKDKEKISDFFFCFFDILRVTGVSLLFNIFIFNTLISSERTVFFSLIFELVALMMIICNIHIYCVCLVCTPYRRFLLFFSHTEKMVLKTTKKKIK